MVYVALEGGEGTGKSTQVVLLAERLGAVAVREPGFTSLGGRLRSLLLDTGSVSIGSRAETLLMAADRAQLMADVVRPALAAGRNVVSDRSAFSSLAYQGGGRRLGVDEVRRVNEWALDGCWPEVVVLLDADPATARARLGAGLDRFEREAEEFHQRVQDAFRELADVEGWSVVAADRSVEAVAEAVWAAVEPHIDPASTSTR
jgi:dTMP kinase